MRDRLSFRVKMCFYRPQQGNKSRLYKLTATNNGRMEEVKFFMVIDLVFNPPFKAQDLMFLINLL